MATDRQIEANRLNAQKCTGPKTPEGKAVSSQNAFKTGICSTSEVIGGESRDKYNELTADFYRDYAPANSGERALVDTLVKTEWLNRRYMSVAADVFERGFHDMDSVSLGRVIDRSSETVVRVDRCQNSVHRNFDRALARLIAVQTQRGVKTPGIQPALPELVLLSEPAIPELFIPEPVIPEPVVPDLVIAEPIPETAEVPVAPAEATETEPLNTKLVSFRTFLNPYYPRPSATPEKTDETPPEPDDTPIAA